MSGTPTNTTTFTATGTIATFIVPATGTYYIEALGAAAGTFGYGGWAAGDVYLTQGETLEIAVGQAGLPGSVAPYGGNVYENSAGGGSFVVAVNGSVETPLIVAGGGGLDGAGGATVGGDGQGGSGVGDGAGFYSDGGGSPGSSVAGGVTIDGFGGAADFADGLAGGGGLETFGPQMGEVTGHRNGGFGGGGGSGGGGYTGGTNGGGGSSYVDPSVTNPILIAGVETGNGFVEITYPACFVQGTRIATPDGYVAVETLNVGDLVLSARRQCAVPVQWLGSRHITHTRVPEPAWACPVRIATGAFGPGQPTRDLFLSPDHAVYAAGVLIPVRVLVNDDSVARHPIDTVTYYHVQVDEHDILLADGLQVESYLEIGQLSAPGAASRVWEAAGCASLCVTGPEVDAVRARLAGALVGARWWLADPLKEIADGAGCHRPQSQRQTSNATAARYRNETTGGDAGRRAGATGPHWPGC